MPIYEYKCSACDFCFEKRQGFDADPIDACPECQNEARRLFKPAPIIFKGKGFYVTDYPSSSSTCSQSKSEEEPKTPVKTESESKPEPAAATPTPSADA